MLQWLCILFVLCVTARPFPRAAPSYPVFNCSSLPPPPPATHVTALRPGNIKVVLALGDSISAGFAMKNWPVEERGLVFSIGGDKYVSDFGNQLAISIPNFLLHYNPSLQGQSHGETIPFTGGAELNGAVSGAKVQDVPGQINYLVNQAQTTFKDKIDWENDWKLLTLFIGANNLCVACTRDDPVTTFEQHLDASLAAIQAKIPKVFVNIMTIFNISGVWNAGQTKEYCTILWNDLGVDECPCLVAHGPEGRQKMDDITVAINAVTTNLAAKYNSKTTGSSTFTVVVQPAVSGLNITHWGEGFLSDFDCFHPNLMADSAFTVGLWNNMYQPPGKKSHDFPTDPSKVKIICPTEDSVLQ